MEKLNGIQVKASRPRLSLLFPIIILKYEIYGRTHPYICQDTVYSCLNTEKFEIAELINLLKKKRIFIADDHQLFIDGIKLIFTGIRSMKLPVPEAAGIPFLSLFSSTRLMWSSLISICRGWMGSQLLKKLKPLIRVLK